MYHSFNSTKANFPESQYFSKVNKVLYVGCGHDNEGLEELATNHIEVLGIDKWICDTSSHVEEREKILRRYPNLHIKSMNAKKLDFPDEYFDGVIFKRSLAYIGGDGAIKKGEDIKLAMDEAHRILCEEGLIWIIYAEADIVDLTLDRMNLLLKSSGFETVEDAEDYIMCRKSGSD